ncbi:hypothetical protein ABBQ32_009035 [Trebouxia sp. C0010 RCD-2024]
MSSAAYWIDTYLRQGVCSDHAEGLRHREVGTAAFRRHDLSKAAAAYSDCLHVLDETTISGSAAASHVYCNRALVLLQQRPPDKQAALQDSTCAIACDRANCKAWYRRACSHEALLNYSAACSDAAMAVQLSSGTQHEDCVRLLQRLQAAAKLPVLSSKGANSAAAAGITADAEPKIPPDMAEIPSLSVPASECMLDVHNSKAQGRQLAVTNNIAAGTVMWTEQPYVHVLLKRHRKQKCSHCLKPLPAQACYSCQACSLVRYCTPHCRQSDSFHTSGGIECGVPWPLLLPADVVLAVRMVSKMSQCSDAQPTESSCTAQDSQANAEHIRSLETHWQQTSPQVLTELTLLSTVAALCCCQYSSGLPSPSAGSILTALLQIHVNGLAVVPAQHTNEEDRVALAVYATASLMNHSCQPNVALAFDGKVLTARAVEALPAGQPVLHCYGPQKGAMITPLRQQQLQQQYHFLCQCRACKTGFDLTEQATVGLQCLDTRCNGLLVPKQAVAAGLCSVAALPSHTGSGCCSKCHHSWSEDLQAASHPVWQTLEAAQAEYQHAMADLKQQQAPSMQTLTAVSGLLRHVAEVQSQCLCPTNQLLCQTWGQLVEVLKAIGTFEEAASCCKKVLDMLHRTYPSNSTAVGYQRLQLADLLRHVGAGAEADDEYVEAMKILHLHFGVSYAVSMHTTLH